MKKPKTQRETSSALLLLNANSLFNSDIHPTSSAHLGLFDGREDKLTKHVPTTTEPTI